MAQLCKVADKKSLEAAASIKAEVGGREIAVFRVNGNYYAIGDTCTHRGGPLSEGDLQGKIVTCPWHGAKFDVTSGKVVGPPALADVPCFKVLVEGEEIKVEIP